MDTKSCSPASFTRKRTRERDHSPDMFAFDEEDEGDSSFGMQQTDMVDQIASEICFTPDNATKLRQSNTVSNNFSHPTPPSSSEQTPKRKILLSSTTQENNNQMLPPSDSKSSGSCSMSSLRSTADSNHFGLNSRMKEALRSNDFSTCRLEFSTTSSLPSGVTPAIYTLNNSSTPTQASIHAGPHFGLSDGVWQVIQQTKGIQTLYEWQDQCLNKAIKSHQNLLYSLPTSGGKTLVAEILMVRELLCNQKHCLFVLPYVSIVQEKIRTLSSLAIALNFAVEEYAGNRGAYPPRKRKSKRVIYIATLEKAHGIVNSLMELGRLQEIGRL